MNRCPYCKTEIDHRQMEDMKCNHCLHEWQIFHVLPVNDEVEHVESYKCPCHPKVDIVEQDIIVIHNSFDGREGVEWANEILNS